MEVRKKGEEESKRLFFFSFACDALAHFSNLFFSFLSSTPPKKKTASPTPSSRSAPSARAACSLARGPRSRALPGSRRPTAARRSRTFRSSRRRQARGEQVREEQQKQRASSSSRPSPLARSGSASAPSPCSSSLGRTLRQSPPPAPSWSLGRGGAMAATRLWRRSCRRLLLLRPPPPRDEDGRKTAASSQTSHGGTWRPSARWSCLPGRAWPRCRRRRAGAGAAKAL